MATVVVSAGLGAASASAAFEAETSAVNLTGEGTSAQYLSFGIVPLNCSGNYSGTGTEASETMTLAPSYSNCKFTNGVGAATINSNGCQFTYDEAGTVAISGASCGGIKITYFNCSVTIPAQSGLKAASYSNEGTGTGRTIRISNEISGISYSQTGSCNGGGSGSFTNGTISAPVSVKGSNGGSAVGIFTTSRHAPRFEAEKYSASISASPGKSETLFGNANGNVSCSSAALSGNLSAASKDLALNQSGSWNCSSSGWIEANVTVSMNSCGYVVHAENIGPPYTASLEIDCTTAGDSIKLAYPFCTVTIPEQTFAAGVALSNTGSGSSRQVDAQVNVSSATYTEKGFACKAGTTGATNNNGVLGGKFTLKGTNGGSQVGLFVAGEKL
jgi:hypothetical protein